MIYSCILWICHLVIAVISIPATLLAVTVVPLLREIVLEGSVIATMLQFFNILISMGAMFLVATTIMLRRPEEVEEEMNNINR